MTIEAIDATQYSIGKIFSNDFIFHIPRYQRPYSWTTKQAGELLDDLLTFVGNEKNIDALSPYFMGSIVLVKLQAKSNVEVVDGQQRLTTLTILLSVLRALISKDEAEQLTIFIYEKGLKILGIDGVYRLNLRKQDKEFFQKYIQNKDMLEDLKQLDTIKLLDSQRNIYDNALFFLKKLSEHSQDDLFRLARAIVTKCFLVVISTSDIGSAYRIFSTLNGRGLDISLTDILKSDLLGKISTTKEEEYTDKWEGAEEQLGRAAFESLFSHIRMIHRQTKLRGTVLAEITDYIHSIDNPEQFIDQIVLPYANAFDTIIQADYQSRHQTKVPLINSLLRWLNRIDNADWLPPAIHYLTRNENDAEALLHFFSDLERLAAGLMIRRVSINGRVERYGKILSAIDDNGDLYAANSPLQLTANEINDIYNELNGNLYLSSEVCRYVMLRLNAELFEMQAAFKYKIITIEHVLPQNPASNSIWLTWFPDKELQEKYVHCLGNLVLLSRRMNSQARNYDFEKKKKIYFTAANGVVPFSLTLQVFNYNTWTPEILEQRQEMLLNKLKNLWRL